MNNKKMSLAALILLLVPLVSILFPISAQATTGTTYSLYDSLPLTMPGASFYDSGNGELYINGNSSVDLWNVAKKSSGISISASSGLNSLTFDLTNSTLYAISFYGTVTPINTLTNEPGTPIEMSSGLNSGLFDPANSTLYVNSFYGTINPINTVAKTASKPITLSSGNTEEMALDSANNTLYAASFSGVITPINTLTNQPGSNIETSIGIEKEIFDSANNTLYAITYSGKITPINTLTNQPEKSITTSSGIFQAALDPASNTLYLATQSDAGNGDIIAFNCTTNTVSSTAVLPTLSSSSGITSSGIENSGVYINVLAYDPTSKEVYAVTTQDALYGLNSNSSGSGILDFIMNLPITGPNEISAFSPDFASPLFYLTPRYIEVGQNPDMLYIMLNSEAFGVIDAVKITIPLPPTTTITSTTTTTTTSTTPPTTTTSTTPPTTTITSTTTTTTTSTTPPTTTTTTTPPTTTPPTTTTSTTTTTLVITKLRVAKKYHPKKKVKTKAKTAVYKKPIEKAIKSVTTIHTGEPWSGVNMYLLYLAVISLIMVSIGWRRKRVSL